MQIIALLDKPSPKSFGMVPIIVRSGLHDHYVLDARPLPRPIRPEEISDLVISGHALDVVGAGAHVADPPRPLAAGWLGAEFLKNVRVANGPEPEIVGTLFPVGPGGSFWIDEPHVVHRALKYWIMEAARTVFVNRDAKLAELMAWTLPDEPYTMAAMWWTRSNDEDRVRYLRGVEQVELARSKTFRLDGLMMVIQSIVQVHVARKTSDD